MEKAVEVAQFAGHSADVMSVSVNPETKTQFVSGACDAVCRLWDIREPSSFDNKTRAVGIYEGHESDVNAVDFMRNGESFCTGSDDSSCRLFDLRAYSCVSTFATDKIVCGITSASLSKGGRVLFAGYDESMCIGWDVFTGVGDKNWFTHDGRVSCLGVSSNGAALATGSWDMIMKVWA